MSPLEMRPWNLALRLGLEIGALIGLGLMGWTQTDGAARWVAVVALPLAAEPIARSTASPARFVLGPSASAVHQ